MVLKVTVKLEMAFSYLISQKPGKIPTFRTFLAKFSNLAEISLKIGSFELGHDYNVTVTYLGCWYLFWYVLNSYTIVPTTILVSGGFIFKFTSGDFIFKFTGGGNHPLEDVVQKILGRTRVKEN